MIPAIGRARIAAGQGSPDQDTPAKTGVLQGLDPSSLDLNALPPELEYFRTSEAYQVELTEFNGPLDLLLFLIQKNEIDIYDIPIARITDQYLQYLEVIQMLSLDTAGDFLVMAATLMRIKTRMLLPVPVEEEMEEEDPRAELVRRLLEYKRFKEAAESLRKFEHDRSRYHLRQSRYPYLNRENIEPPLQLGLYDLLSALANVFDRIVTPAVHHVQREPFTVEEKMALIRERLQNGATVQFEDLFRDDAIKMEVIVTFIAILELVRQGVILFFQTENLGPLWLKRNESSAVWSEPTAPTASGSGLLKMEAQG